MSLLAPNEILTSVLPVAGKAATSEAARRRRSDHELQLVRRLDWRFLLPEPHLRRVAYLGPEQGTLPAALKCFSESFRNISSAENACVDLVVLSLREASILSHAARLLAPGGFLYWEMKPVRWAASPRRAPATERARPAALKSWSRTPKLFRGEVDTLVRLGFREIEMHWLRPNFEACLEIIPMNDPVALEYAFSCPRSDWASRLKFAAGRMMMQTGLLAHLTPCFSLVARKGSDNA